MLSHLTALRRGAFIISTYISKNWRMVEFEEASGDGLVQLPLLEPGYPEPVATYMRIKGRNSHCFPTCAAPGEKSEVIQAVSMGCSSAGAKACPAAETSNSCKAGPSWALSNTIWPLLQMLLKSLLDYPHVHTPRVCSDAPMKDVCLKTKTSKPSSSFCFFFFKSHVTILD